MVASPGLWEEDGELEWSSTVHRPGTQAPPLHRRSLGTRLEYPIHQTWVIHNTYLRFKEVVVRYVSSSWLESLSQIASEATCKDLNSKSSYRVACWKFCTWNMHVSMYFMHGCMCHAWYMHGTCTGLPFHAWSVHGSSFHAWYMHGSPSMHNTCMEGTHDTVNNDFGSKTEI